jgi:hypothetical protein
VSVGDLAEEGDNLRQGHRQDTPTCSRDRMSDVIGLLCCCSGSHFEFGISLTIMRGFAEDMKVGKGVLL